MCFLKMKTLSIHLEQRRHYCQHFHEIFSSLELQQKEWLQIKIGKKFYTSHWKGDTKLSNLTKNFIFCDKCLTGKISWHFASFEMTEDIRIRNFSWVTHNAEFSVELEMSKSIKHIFWVIQAIMQYSILVLLLFYPADSATHIILFNRRSNGVYVVW